MFKRILDIIENNNNTFYDYSTGAKENIKVALWKKALLAIIIAYIFPKLSVNLINSVLTVYSILLGFGFSALFYLVSIKNCEKEVSKDKEKKLPINFEDDLIKEKNSMLVEEIFYNVSYFNITSIALICFSLINMLFICESDFAIRIHLLSIYKFNDLYTVFAESLIDLLRGALFAFIATFYLLIIESLFTFFRVVCRIGYYFDRIIKS